MIWQALEVKRPGDRVRPEQQALADASGILIVRSWDEALAAVQEMGGLLLGERT